MERDEARKEAAKAREETAHWRGQVEALKEQQRGFWKRSRPARSQAGQGSDVRKRLINRNTLR
jgi:hypothetical protein